MQAVTSALLSGPKFINERVYSDCLAIRERSVRLVHSCCLSKRLKFFQLLLEFLGALHSSKTIFGKL